MGHGYAGVSMHIVIRFYTYITELIGPVALLYEKVDLISVT